MRQRGFEIVNNKKNTYEFDDSKIPMIPRRADRGSCAYDFYAPYDFVIYPNQQRLIWTDIKSYMLEDEVLIINVRSSQGKLKIQLANTQGWIDSTYYNNPDNEGNIGIFIRNENDVEYEVSQGDKFCQGMFTKYLTTDEDNPILQDRLGGWGSSGK